MIIWEEMVTNKEVCRDEMRGEVFIRIERKGETELFTCENELSTEVNNRRKD